MKSIKVTDAVGLVLAHDVTKIVPGEFKGRLFKKGHVIREEDIEKLLDIGKENVYIFEQKEGELHEDDAAKRIGAVVKGKGVIEAEEIKEGKVDFFAECDGVLKINKELLLKANSIGEIIISTLHTNTYVKKGDKIAGARVIPLIIDEEQILTLEELVKREIIWVEEIKAKNTLLITTGNEVYNGRIKDAFYPVIKEKLEFFGSTLKKQVILRDSKEDIKNEILKGIESGVDMIICTGGMSVDPDDVTNTAIKECGATLVSYGSPVLPGAMFLLSYYNDIPILGVPSCAMYSRRTMLDLVLPRILTDEKLTREDIVEYGHGGLCLDCKICTFPNCHFGK